MHKIYYLNDFEIKSIFSHFKDRNIICMIPGATYNDIAKYVLFFELNGLIMSVCVNYSTPNQYDKKPNFSLFLDKVNLFVSEDFDKFNDCIINEDAVEDDNLTPFLFNISSSIFWQLDNLSYCGFSLTNFSDFSLPMIQESCEKFLKEGLGAKDIYINTMRETGFKQSDILEALLSLESALDKVYFN